MASATPHLYGYLPSRKASLLIGWYQIILLGDRGTCVLTTCPGLHSIAERPGFELATCWSQVQRPNHSATEPQVTIDSLSGGVKYTRVVNICDFRPKSLFISETRRDRPMVTMDHWQEVICIRSIRVNSNDVKWPWKAGREVSKFSGESHNDTLVWFDLEWPNLAKLQGGQKHVANAALTSKINLK